MDEDPVSFRRRDFLSARCAPLGSELHASDGDLQLVAVGGLLATVAQLGQLTGAAAFGTLFLNRLESLGAPEAYTSAEALRSCVFALAGTAAVGAVSGLVLRRR